MRQNFAKQVFKKWGRGVVAKKQPQVVKIPPHMVHKLYSKGTCQSMLGGKKKKKN